MIQANELRIGNLVVFNTNSKPFPITADGILEIHKLGNTEMPFNYEPVPLTEGWLLKAGFAPRNEHRGIGAIYDYGHKGHEDDWKFSKSVSFIHDKNDENDIYLHFLQHQTALKIKYLHQLQNLYFSLTGEELTITP